MGAPDPAPAQERAAGYCHFTVRSHPAWKDSKGLGEDPSSVLVWGKVCPMAGESQVWEQHWPDPGGRWPGADFVQGGRGSMAGQYLGEGGIAAPVVGWGQDRDVLDFGLSWDWEG